MKLVKSTLITALSFTIALSMEASANPCQPIAEACMQAGYSKGAAIGHRLIKDCVQPITAKTMTLPNTAFTDEELQQCGAMIAQKMSTQ